MADKYINATKLIERMKYLKTTELASCHTNPYYAGTGMQIQLAQLYDGVISVLENAPEENVVAKPAPNWPICQNCGLPMVYCGEERTGNIVWKRYSCKECFNQSCARRIENGEEKYGRCE